jgi:TonB family protein
MSTLLIYTLKVSLYLTAFYTVYSLLLSRDTAYGRNRAFIIISLVTSIILPLISFYTLRPHHIQYFGKLLSEVFIVADSDKAGSLLPVPIAEKSIYMAFLIYIAGIGAVLLKIAADLTNLMILVIRKRESENNIIVFNGFNTSGFSAMGYIFINSRLTPDESKEIIRHEQNHISQNHFADIVFIELVIALQWFNPVIYLFNRSLRAVHEFQADQECLNSGINVISYQNLLLRQVFSSRIFNLTNSFSNPSLVKKRMVMMTKKRTSALANIKIISVIPVIIVVSMAISAYREIPNKVTDYSALIPRTDNLPEPEDIGNIPAMSENKKQTVYKEASAKPETKKTEALVPPPPPPRPSESDLTIKTAYVQHLNNKTEKDIVEIPFDVVEEMPQFPGGDNALLNYLAKNTSYPENAKKHNIQGRVIVKFCINSKGNVNQVSILKGVSPELDQEAVRVVKTIPSFSPGRQDGKPVPVWYMVPITFSLK